MKFSKLFRLYAKIIFIVVLSARFLSPPLLYAETKLDQQFGIDYRSHPKSGLANYQLGLSRILYGKAIDDSENFNPWYGGIRIAVKTASIISYHEVAAKIELYPVSFFKIEYEQLHFKNTQDYDSFDCVAFSCIGDGKKISLGATLSLAYQDWFSRWQFLKHDYKFYSRDRFSILPDFGLSINSGGTKLHQSTLSLGRFINQSWLAFYYLDRVHKADGDGAYKISALFVGKKVVNQTFLLGAGKIDTELNQRGYSLLLAYRWQLNDSIFP